jgi:inhibitor of cysteine peptidase
MNKLWKKVLSVVMAITVIVGGVAVANNGTNTNPDVSTVLKVGSKSTLESLLSNLRTSEYYRDSGILQSPSQNENQVTGTLPKKDIIDTNEQVEGVREGDIVKTDGNIIYYISNGDLKVFTVGTDKKISSTQTVDLGEFQPFEMYITDSRLVLIGNTYDEQFWSGIMPGFRGPMWFNNSGGTVKIYDRSNLKEVYDLKTNTWIIKHRMIDNNLYLVSSKNLWMYGDDQEDVRPYLAETVDNKEEKKYVDYDNLYYFEGIGFESISLFTTIDVNTLENSYNGFLVNVNEIYMNTDSVYTAGAYYRYDETNNVSSSSVQTVVMKFDVNNNLNYKGASVLDGNIVNQFSMDEHDGLFRIALTNQKWSYNMNTGESVSTVSNNIYILREDIINDRLITVSVSPHLGKPGETIRSVRFTGNLARVTTFLQTDPLYTIDLNDNFRIISEIEETGFSTYMHDWGNGIIVGLGHSADIDGRITGMKISVYSTLNGETKPLGEPLLFNNGTIDGWNWSWSDALYNHKAMLVSPEKNILGLSVNSWNVDNNSWTYESQYMIFSIDPSSSKPVKQITTIEHEKSPLWYSVDRGVYIDGVVYTLSNYQMVSYDLASNSVLESIKI